MEGLKISLECPPSHDVSSLGFLSATGRDIEKISAVSFYIHCLPNEVPNVGTTCQNSAAVGSFFSRFYGESRKGATKKAWGNSTQVSGTQVFQFGRSVAATHTRRDGE